MRLVSLVKQFEGKYGRGSEKGNSEGKIISRNSTSMWERLHKKNTIEKKLKIVFFCNLGIYFNNMYYVAILNFIG